ncbi:hypothetical protein ACWEKT_11595 [Nocardia takedensis]
MSEFVREFNSLEEVDPLSYDRFMVLMDLAERGTLRPDDYKAPIGRGLTQRRTRPWLGEFQADGFRNHRGRCDQHRLYFGEAPVEKNSLTACLIGTKQSKTEPRIWRPKQDRHIGKAMDRLLSWCKRGGHLCRML